MGSRGWNWANVRAEEMAALVLLPCQPTARRLHVRHERPAGYASSVRVRFGGGPMGVEDEGERQPVAEAPLGGKVILGLLALLEWSIVATIRSFEFCKVCGDSLDH